LPIKHAQLRVYVHATEDEEKVFQSIKNSLPEEVLREAKIIKETYYGHYGNPITVITVTINNPRLAERTLNYLLEKLGASGRHILSSSLEDRVDKGGSLFFRISKQDAYMGSITIYETDDVIRISIGFSGKRKDAIEYYRRMLESAGKRKEDS